MHWWLLLPLLLLRMSVSELVSSDLDKRQALINTSVSLHDVSDHFLSITFHLNDLPDLPWADPSVIKLAREFSPAWFKVTQEPTTNLSDTVDFSLYQWAALNHFTSESGFKQMWDAKFFSRAARRWKLNGFHKITGIQGVPNVHEFPPPPNQIGFSVTNRSLVDIANIRDLFPRRYDTEDLTIVGPNIKFFINYDEVKSFSKWLQMYGQSVSGISWSPSVLFGNENESIESMLTTKHSDLFRLEQIVLRGMADQLGFANKKIWISDLQVRLENDEFGELAGTFGAALVWLDRLGAAAVNGVDVAFQPNLLPMHERGVRQQPSPEYWVGVLHKRLAGTRVLQVSSRCQGNAGCRLYAHCTPNDTRSHYRDGSLTMFAINMKSTELKGSVVDWTPDNPMHLYVLTGDINSKKIYLNDELLEIDPHTGDLPPLRPNIIPSPRDIILPPYSMAFWVFPNIKASACDMSSKRRKRSDSSHMALIFPIEDIEKEGENESTTTKQKRCYNQKNVPVASPIPPKILLDTKIRADDCPSGCYQCNKGPCQIQGLNIVAPGCTTSQLLQRLIDLSRKRRTECCCDDHGLTTPPYEYTDYTRKRLQLADNNDIAYTENVTPRLSYTSTPNQKYLQPSVEQTYSTGFSDVYSQTQHTTHHYDEPKKRVVAILKDYSSSDQRESDEESPAELVQQYKSLIADHNIVDDNRIQQVDTIQKYTPIYRGENSKYLGSDKYNSNDDGSSNYQYKNQLYTKSPLAGPTTPINNIIFNSMSPKYPSTYNSKSVSYSTNTPSYHRPTTPYPYQDRIPAGQYNSDINSIYKKSPGNAQNPFYRMQTVTNDDNAAYETTIPTTHNFYQPTTAIPKSYPNRLRAGSNLTPRPTTYAPKTINDYSKQETYNTHIGEEYDLSSNKLQQYSSQSYETDNLSYPEKRIKSETNAEYDTHTTERPVRYATSVSPDGVQYQTPKPQGITKKLQYTDGSKKNNDYSELRTDNSFDYTQMPHTTKYKTKAKPDITEEERSIEYSTAITLPPLHNLRLASDGDDARVVDFRGNEDKHQDKTNYEQNQQMPTQGNNNELSTVENNQHRRITTKNLDQTTESRIKTLNNEINENLEKRINNDNDPTALPKNTFEESGVSEPDDDNIQDRLSDPNRHIYPPQLYAPYPPFPPKYPHHYSHNYPNLLDKLKYDQQHSYNTGILPQIPYNHEYDSKIFNKLKTPLLGLNGIEHYPGFDSAFPKKPFLHQPPAYYDPYSHMYNNNGFNKDLHSYYEGNNFLGRKKAFNLDPLNKLNYGQSPFGAAGFGLRLQGDEQDKIPSTENSSDIPSEDTVSERVSVTTHPSQISNKETGVLPYKQTSNDNYRNRENKYPIISDTSTYPDSHKKYPDITSPILADDFVLKCSGNKVCNQNILYKFVETIFRHLVDKGRGGLSMGDYIGTHACGDSKTGRELCGNDLLIDNLQDVLARGTDRRRIKLGSVYVECPENCCNDNPCGDQFSRKIKIILSLISWLKDCINKK